MAMMDDDRMHQTNRFPPANIPPESGKIILPVEIVLQSFDISAVKQ